ncbi:hypothetical protein YTPLAS21_06340 [Candidatus Nitrosocosmicus sp.]|uniref:hypothetical protein n=1 Tax=Candidatus Nitrosocosmicus sp. FF01 TaxID=3397670 RepID=UPI002ACCA008|nr:hypothetical protein YTPLAS21_06340 [Candidatus Nitrosocosmicus sp.]
MRIKLNLAILAQIILVLGGLVFCTSMSQAMAQSNYTIKVAKTTEGDFTITDGASYIGTYFDTTYSMTGTVNDFIKAKDELITSILDDFGKSSTIGYIKMNSTTTQTDANVTEIANPFVSKEQIDEKIKSVLAYALDKIENPVGIMPDIGDSREIRCVFGNVLNDFWCDIPTFMSR